MRLGPRLAKLVVFANGAAIVFLALVQARIIRLPEEYDPFAMPNLRDAPGLFTQTRLHSLDSDLQGCVEALNKAGVKVSLQPTPASDGTCTTEGSVILPHLSQAGLKPELMRCAVAARLYMWERHVLQPLARATFGENVREITHFGSYSCRTIANSSHMSEHATANALDVSGMVLKSGRRISVKRGWIGDAKEQAFLHQARDGLCQYFNLTLSPDYNADHEDHLHVDMGNYKRCR